VGSESLEPDSPSKRLKAGSLGINCGSGADNQGFTDHKAGAGQSIDSLIFMFFTVTQHCRSDAKAPQGFKVFNGENYLNELPTSRCQPQLGSLLIVCG
jgi:hypothetical protein